MIPQQAVVVICFFLAVLSDEWMNTSFLNQFLISLASTFSLVRQVGFHSWTVKSLAFKSPVTVDVKITGKGKRLYIRSTPHPVTVTTRIITFLVGNPYKPSFVTVTGWGGTPNLYIYIYNQKMAFEK